MVQVKAIHHAQQIGISSLRTLMKSLARKNQSNQRKNRMADIVGKDLKYSGAAASGEAVASAVRRGIQLLAEASKP